MTLNDELICGQFSDLLCVANEDRVTAFNLASHGHSQAQSGKLFSDLISLINSSLPSRLRTTLPQELLGWSHRIPES